MDFRSVTMTTTKPASPLTQVRTGGAVGDADENTTAQGDEHRDEPEALRPEKRHGEVLVLPRGGGGGGYPRSAYMMRLAARVLLLQGGCRREVAAAERPRLTRLRRRSGRRSPLHDRETRIISYTLVSRTIGARAIVRSVLMRTEGETAKREPPFLSAAS